MFVDNETKLIFVDNETKLIRTTRFFYRKNLSLFTDKILRTSVSVIAHITICKVFNIDMRRRYELAMDVYMLTWLS